MIFTTWSAAVASALRAGLAAAEVPYAAAMWWRNRRYDRGLGVQHVEVPVISIGNLTVGGTGKTPLVKWLARYLRGRDVRVSIVSRGYGAQLGGANDEALEIECDLPDVPHVQNPDRVAAARLAIDELATQLILLDDGFQHRRLARDLDIVLLDATQPFGFGHLLPRGTLREGFNSLRRADIVCLTRSDLVAADRRLEIQSQLRRYTSRALWCEATHRPLRLTNASGHMLALSELNDRPVFAFSGIGNPLAFQRTMEATGAKVVGQQKFADHHAYCREDIDSLSSAAMAADAEWLVCTQKDLVKIGVDEVGGRPLWAVAIDIEFLAGQQQLQARLDEIVAGLPIEVAADE
jgi:tetraacyldisaccharide 4'-kinase